LKKIEVVQAGEVKIEPLDLPHFILSHTPKRTSQKITKKKIKAVAEQLGLSYNEREIVFAKKIINAYIQQKEIQ